MSGDPRIEEHLQKTENERDPMGRKEDAAEAVERTEESREADRQDGPREPAPNPTQQRMDEEGVEARPVDVPWWSGLVRKLRGDRGR